MGAGRYTAAIIARRGVITIRRFLRQLFELALFPSSQRVLPGSQATLEDIFRFTASGETNRGFAEGGRLSNSKRFHADSRCARCRSSGGPIWKRISAGSPETFDSLPDSAASLQQAIHQALQIGALVIPLTWDLVRDAL